MQENNHFTIAWLVKCMLDVVIKDVNLVSTNTRVLKSIDMRFQNTTQTLLSNIGTNIQVFQFGVAFPMVDNQFVLFYQICLFLFFCLSSFVLLLNVLNESEGCV